MSLPNLLLYLVLAAPGGPTCLDALLPSIGAQDWAEVVRLGAIERERTRCAAEAELITYNVAVAWERLGEAGEEGASCRSHALYLFVASRTKDADIERASRESATRLKPTCSAQPARAQPAAVGRRSAPVLEDPPTRVDETAESGRGSTRTVLFVAAGISALAAGGLYVGAVAAQEQKDVFAEQYLDAVDGAQRAEHAANFDAASESTDLLGYSAIGLGVVAAGLGLAALLLDEEPGDLRVRIAPGQIGLAGRF